MTPTIIKAKMGGGCLSKLLGVNSEHKGEMEGSEKTLALIFKCFCLGCSRLITSGSVRNIS